MFAAGIFPITAVGDFISSITSTIGDNIGPILMLFAFIVGLSIVMTFLDMRAEARWFDNYNKRWKQ